MSSFLSHASSTAKRPRAIAAASTQLFLVPSDGLSSSGGGSYHPSSSDAEDDDEEDDEYDDALVPAQAGSTPSVDERDVLPGGFLIRRPGDNPNVPLPAYRQQALNALSMWLDYETSQHPELPEGDPPTAYQQWIEEKRVEYHAGWTKAGRSYYSRSKDPHHKLWIDPDMAGDDLAAIRQGLAEHAGWTGPLPTTLETSSRELEETLLAQQRVIFLDARSISGHSTDLEAWVNYGPMPVGDEPLAPYLIQYAAPTTATDAISKGGVYFHLGPSSCMPKYLAAKWVGAACPPVVPRPDGRKGIEMAKDLVNNHLGKVHPSERDRLVEFWRMREADQMAIGQVIVHMPHVRVDVDGKAMDVMADKWCEQQSAVAKAQGKAAGEHYRDELGLVEQNDDDEMATGIPRIPGRPTAQENAFAAQALARARQRLAILQRQ